MRLRWDHHGDSPFSITAWRDNFLLDGTNTNSRETVIHFHDVLPWCVASRDPKGFMDLEDRTLIITGFHGYNLALRATRGCVHGISYAEASISKIQNPFGCLPIRRTKLTSMY